MFEIDSSPKTAKEEEQFMFDIEKEIKDEAAYKNYLEDIAMKRKKVEELRREGGSKSELEQLNLLLEGYDAMLNTLKIAKKAN